MLSLKTLLNSLIGTIALGACLATHAQAAGGEAKGASGPLRAAYGNVKTVIDGDIARTVLTQVFVNDLPHPVEVSYSFPLPSDATVTAFSEWRDGRKITAKTEGKAAAKATYEAAVNRGERAAHGETEAGRRFRMTLSSIPARGQRRIELRYIQTLTALGSERSFVFPAQGDAPAATVLDIEVVVQAERAILGLEAPNQLDAQIGRGLGGDERRQVVRLTRGREGLRRDLVARWSQDSDAFDLAARAVRPDPEAPAFLEARFAFNADPLEGAAAPRDVVIVLDRSMSMAGEPLDNAKALAAAIVRGLNSSDRLEVISFGTEPAVMFGELASVTDGFAKATIAFVDDLRAGGRSALEPALHQAADLLKDSPNGILVLLSDGQPTFGAGDDPFGLELDVGLFASTRVVIGHFNYPTRTAALDALFPNVTARFVPDGPAAKRAIIDIARLAVAPSIEGLSVEILGEGVHMVQGALPDRVAMGESVRLLARMDTDAIVIVRGTLHGEPVYLEAEVRLRTGSDDLGLPVEWARLRARDLEAEYMSLRASAGGEAERELLEAEIRGLGTLYGLATRFTGYVMTDSLAPDHIKPGDPEIRIHAPESAKAVFGVLPWGEVIRCNWDEDEGLWFGRFLVPRGTADGLYKTRIFVVGQAETTYRGALYFRVDSDIPDFTLARDDGEQPVARGEWLALRAMPIGRDPDFASDGASSGASNGDRLDPDPIDVKSVEVHVGETTYVLNRDSESDLWGGKVLIDLPPGRHDLELVATDYARNTVTATLSIEVQ